MRTTWYVDAAVIVLGAIGLNLALWQFYRSRRRPASTRWSWEESLRAEMADVHAVHGRRLELPGRRPDVLGLAMTVGLLLFLFAEAVPRGFSGPQGFWIGAGGLVALVVVVLLIAVTVDNARSHRRSSADEGLDDFGFTRLAEQIQGLHATLADDATANLADLLRRWDSIALPDRTREVQYLAERAGFWSDEELKGLMMLLGRASASQRALLTFLVKGRP